MLPHLSEHQLDLVVACPPGPLRDALPVDVRWLPLSLPAGRGAESDAVLRVLLAVMRSSGAELVHANSLHMSRLAGPACSASGLPSIGHLRDIVRLSRSAVRDLNRHSRLLAVSRAAGQFHRAQGVDGGRLHVLYNGVDLHRFRPGAGDGRVRRELGLSSRDPLLLTVGQISLRKGLDTLLEAASIVLESRPDVRWLIVGRRHSNKQESIEYEQQLAGALQQPPLRGRVLWLGERSDVPQLMRDCQLLVHAARQEPLGRVLLEAAASGLPVVATEVGGTGEIFEPLSQDAEPCSHVPAALLAPPGQPAELAQRTTALLADAARRAEMGRQGRVLAAARFDATASARELASHYRRIWHNPA